MNKTKLIGIGLVVVAIGISVLFLISEKVTVAPTTSQKQAESDYKNATYEIEGKMVTLVNGVSEEEAVPGSASKIITHYFGNEAQGDLNNDGLVDTAFILTKNLGGSGTFYYVVVALSSPKDYIGTNGVLLGDRIAPQTTEIKNGVLTVNYADRKPSDPMTAKPSVGKSIYLVIDKEKLVETPIVIESPEKDSEISSPLIVTGLAKGNWFFEASFPMILTDWDGKIIAQSHVTAQSDWMTTDYVRFSGALTFTKPVYNSHGFLILRKDNPSGLPQNDDSLEIPVLFR